MTGREFLFEICDEKFWSSDLNEEGNAFAESYYGTGSTPRKYIPDYERTLARGLKSTYHVADTWENYDKITTVIAKRYESWKNGKNKPWWKIWS